jgi:hypothetical protein
MKYKSLASLVSLFLLVAIPATPALFAEQGGSPFGFLWTAIGNLST